MHDRHYEEDGARNREICMSIHSKKLLKTTFHTKYMTLLESKYPLPVDIGGDMFWRDTGELNGK